MGFGIDFRQRRADSGQREKRLLRSRGPSRPRDVWQQLRTQYAKLADYAQPPMTAINESYESPDVELHDGDELAFIPPVAGG